MSVHDLSVEQAVLGALLFDNAAVEHADRLRAHHFFDSVHGRLFDEILKRARAGDLADAVTLKDWAAHDAGMVGLGGPDYLLTLIDSAAVMSSYIAPYADQLIDLAQRRAVIAAANEAIVAARTGEPSIAPLEAKLHEIDAADAGADNWRPIGDVVSRAVTAASEDKLQGIPSGITRLDEMTGGLQGLIFIGGASSMGKSLFGAAIMRNVAKQGYGVGEFHLEMLDEQIGGRTVTALGSNPGSEFGNPHYLSLARNALSPSQWDRVRFGQQAAQSLPIWIDARPRRTLAQIESAGRRLIRQWRAAGIHPGAFMIDHEGLIAPEPGQRFTSQIERTNARAEGLLALQKSLGVPIVVLCQITKEGKRADGDERLPTTDDLKYGGALAEAANIAILLHRRAYYAERKPKHMRTQDDLDAVASRDCTVIVDKARGGKRGHLTVQMDLPTAAVWEAA
ncbi:MAG TPA: replicative DNA helicase [Terricaulis sp.]|nr:replicative DNA helicase [Terricaulis sp.]